MMTHCTKIFCFLFFYICLTGLSIVHSQCPEFSNFNITGNSGFICEGQSIVVTHDGANIPLGSQVEWYIGPGTSFNPYNGEGTFIGAVPVDSDPCNNPPQVLYIMVNPDNSQVGGTGDQCDEFMVIWTGSGGFETSDILITNLGPGTFMWDSFIAGNAANFSCGTALPPGPVPANAILIIQSSPNNNVPINSNSLCASGLPVYIIAYDGTTSCFGGYFDNNSPCSSCPVMIDIDGVLCQFMVDLDYQPPPGSINGWAWTNTGSGVFADVIPAVMIPVFDPPETTIPPFNWTVPSDFCEVFGMDNWFIAGILDPPPMAGCPELITPYFETNISCPQMMLSGGGDVCEGNCPQDPNEITFSLTGNDVPFVADIVVTAALFPPFQISDLEIINGQSIFVCLGGLFPSFDPSTGILMIPSFAIGFTAMVEVVSIVSASGCPVDISPNSISLHFIQEPTAQAGANQTICSHETVMLSGSIGGSAVNANWSTNGDGAFSDPEALNTIYTPGPGDITTGQVQLTLTGSDENSACIPAVSELTITIEPSLTIETNTPLTVCNTDEAIIVAMVSGGSAPCLWETSGDGSFVDPSAETTIYTPGFNDILTGSVTLFYLPVDPGVCLESSEPLFITIVPAPEVGIPQNLEICEEDSIVINISISGAFTNVVWSASGDGVLEVANIMEITYTPGPLDIDDQFFIVTVMIESAFPECGVTTYNIPVFIVQCDCPPFQTIPPAAPVCAESDQLDLSALLVSGGSGSWSITAEPPGNNPATINGNVFNTDMSDPGIYTITYTLNNPEIGCPSTSSEDVVVNSPIQVFAGLDRTICGIQSVMLNGFMTPSLPVPVQWEALGDGMFSNPNGLNTSYTPGMADSITGGLFLILHVMDPVCGSQSDTLSLIIQDTPFADFVNDTVTICNSVQNGSILNFFSLITAGDDTGLWTNTSGVPIDFSNPASVDFDGIASGYYTFQYQTNSAMSPCLDATYTLVVSVEDCQCPLLIVQNLPGGLCNSLASISLNAFLMAGAPGSWQILNTPPGSNPGSVSGADFIINGCDPGEYRVRFTFDAAPIDGCPDSAEITLMIQDEPMIVISGDNVTCGQTSVQLHAAWSGSAIGVLWSSSGLGMFNDPSSPDPEYFPSGTDVAAASIDLIATTLDTFGFCPNGSDTLQLQLVTPPSTTFSSLTETLCDHPDSLSVINLLSYIVEGDGTGFWTDLDGAMVNLSNPSAVDFMGVASGSYRLMYTTQSAVPPCVDSVYIFTVVIQDCSCPPLVLSSSEINLCQSDMMDLDDQIINAAPGAWSITAGPMPWPQINGSQLSTDGAATGNFLLTYTLTDSIPDCPASATVSLVIESIPFISIAVVVCNASHTEYEVALETDASDLAVDFGVLSSVGPWQYTITGIPAGQDIVLTATSITGLCTQSLDIQAPDCNCTLFIEDLADTITFCPGDTFVLIPFVTGAQGLPFVTWVTPQGSKMQPTLPLHTPGLYVWIVRDEAGCEQRDTFYAAFMGPEEIVWTGIPVSCAGHTDGQIMIESIVGGEGPFTIQLDGGMQQIVSSFPYVLSMVGEGMHQVSIADMIGCTLKVDVVLGHGGTGSIDLGPDITLPKGDSVWINPVATNIHVGTVNWDPLISSMGLSAFWFTPESSTLISIMVSDTSGCLYSDELLITVYEEVVFYIPTIFSPNGDQINDILEVHSNLPEEQLISLEIFDRWGGLIHAQYRDTPFRWDGTSKNRKVISGVYVYKVLWKDNVGTTRMRTGDITVLR